jgi:hypothetical protein
VKTHKWRDVSNKTFGPEKAEEIRKQAQDELEAEAWFRQEPRVAALLAALPVGL